MIANGLPISVESLLQGQSVEWERLEFKKGWNPEAVLHTLCAFANDFHNLGGGYILIGIEEQNGRPVLPPAGVDPEQIDGIQKEILGLGHNAIQPAYHPLTAPVTIQGKQVLVIWVPGGEMRPYKARISLSETSSGRAWYIRKQSSTVVAKQADERELMGLTATVPFDDRYNQSAAVGDLSLRLIEEFLKEVGSDLAQQVSKIPMEPLGRQMNIVGGPAEAAFPKNVGLMFFNPNPEQFFPVTRIDVVWFPDGPGGDKFEEKIFKGPLDHMTRDALSHIERNYLKETVIKYPDRAEADRIWNFPYAAIEEAVVNAVYHRSYEVREPIEVRITPDELVVLSFPGPDRSIRMKDLIAGKAVSRRYRNRRIGEFFKELDLAEGRSTGIPKILRAIRHNGSPEPVFETDEDRSYFLVRFPVHPKAMRSVEIELAGVSAKAKLGNLTVQVGTKPRPGQDQVPTPVGAESNLPHKHPASTQQVTRQVRKLLESIVGEMSRSQIMDALGLKDRVNFSRTYLEPALAEKLLEMTQPESPTSPTQEYRLTTKGKELLEQHK